MNRITIINSGGGVAKTSTSVNLAAALAHLGKRVLLVDLDGQGTASDWLGHATGDKQHLLLDVMLGELDAEDAVKQTYLPSLHLIPSSYHLYQAERHLADEVAADSLLKIALDSLDGAYDYAIVDTPPQLGILSYNAMLAAPAGLLVPCEASYKSLKAMGALMRVIRLMKARRCPEIDVLGILPCRVDRRTTSSTQAVEVLRENFGDVVFSTIVTEAVAMKDAPAHHQAVMDYMPASQSAEQIQSFADEVVQRMSKGEATNAAA